MGLGEGGKERVCVREESKSILGAGWETLCGLKIRKSLRAKSSDCELNFDINCAVGKNDDGRAVAAAAALLLGITPQITHI